LKPPSDRTARVDVAERFPWAKLVAGLLVGFAVLQASASLLGSDRGHAGLLVGLLVVAVMFGIERLLFQHSFTAAAHALALGRPAVRGLVTDAALGCLLLLVLPLYSSCSSRCPGPSRQPQCCWRS
jgi:hypothetical protein